MIDIEEEIRSLQLDSAGKIAMMYSRVLFVV